MLWLRVAVVVFAIIVGLGQTTVVSRNVTDFISGVTPGQSNFMVTPNPGVRNAIFDINPDTDGNLESPFIYDINEKTYFPKFHFHTIRSYDEYKKFVSSSISFSTLEDSETTLDSLEPNKQEELAIKRQFEGNNVEAAIITLEILTNIVSIDSFAMPNFTPEFERALTRLNEAAAEPNSASSQSTLKTFFRTYGTHFARKTHLGSQIVFGKLFPGRAADDREDAARVQCVLESAVETLLSAAHNATDSTTLRFSRIAAGKCGQGHIPTLVNVNGPLPGESFDQWGIEAIKNPRPIRQVVEKMSSLFKEDFMKDVLKKHSPSASELNLCRLRRFLDGDAKEDGTDSPCQPPVQSVCLAGEEDTKSTPQYGPVLIMGGLRLEGDRDRLLSSGEAIGTAALPDLPHAVSYGTLAAAGSKIYSCGGRLDDGSDTSACHVIDRVADNAGWSATTSLPRVMSSHTAVTIKDHIWIAYETHLYDLDTESNQFLTVGLPMNTNYGHCAVSNGSHSFIIGAGYRTDEIWVNTEEYSPAAWHRVGRLWSERQHMGCVWFEQEVFITGGYLARDDAVVFDTQTHTLRSAGTLVQGREGHGMMVLDGRPAVVGGEDDSAPLSSIESYDHSTGKWATSTSAILEVGAYFGFVQLHA